MTNLITFYGSFLQENDCIKLSPNKQKNPENKGGGRIFKEMWKFLEEEEESWMHFLDFFSQYYMAKGYWSRVEFCSSLCLFPKEMGEELIWGKNTRKLPPFFNFSPSVLNTIFFRLFFWYIDFSHISGVFEICMPVCHDDKFCSKVWFVIQLVFFLAALFALQNSWSELQKRGMEKPK